MPKMVYRGQKLTKLVKTKIAAITNKTIPNVPGSLFIKNNTTIAKAMIVLIIRSAAPMFFFMIHSPV